jgi:hypothetical protein
MQLIHAFQESWTHRYVERNVYIGQNPLTSDVLSAIQLATETEAADYYE